MEQYNKLFNKAEIEYITPFLKLWMSFNNWYKEDLKDVKTDTEAVKYYKEEGLIKKYFKRLLEGRSNENEKFQEALHAFVKQKHSCKNKNDYSDDIFYKNPEDIIVQEEALLYISQNHKEYYYADTDFDRVFSETLENIYQVRCSLVHGDFDIEDTTFLSLVENSYKILYPIMDRILQNTEG